MTPTQRKIRGALIKASEPLTHYELSARVGVKGGTFERAVLDLLEREVLVEVYMRGIMRLKLTDVR